MEGQSGLRRVDIALPGALFAFVGLALVLLLVLPERSEETSAPTRIAEVDAIIEAVERQDENALLGLIGYQRIGCRPGTGDDYIVPPSCPEGTPRGTALEVFMAGGCHPRWVRPAEVPDSLEWVSDSRLEVRAVFRGGEPFATFPADYRVVLSGSAQPAPGLSTQMGIAGGEIVWLTGWCGSVEQQLAYLQDIGAEPVFLVQDAIIGP